MIEKFPTKPWDWYWISMNPNLTMEMIEKNATKPWDWDYISMNRNITMEMIEKNPTKSWDWNNISRNNFSKNKEEFIFNKVENYFEGLISTKLIKILLNNIDKLDGIY